MTAPAASMLDVALDALANRLAVVPPAENGTKAPLGKWKQYQERIPTEEEVRAWYAAGRTGIGILTGAVSGNLEMLEFEGRAVDDNLLDEFQALADAAGLGDLVARIITGYAESTPSGGIHLLYRVTDGPVAGSTKLARRPTDDPENPVEVLIETRGEGGYTIVAPSHGKVHPSGSEWALLNGGFSTIADISAQERDELHRVARALDRMPKAPAKPSPAPSPGKSMFTSDGPRPGDDYNAAPDAAERTLDLLERHNWVEVFRRGHDVHLRRPGKNTGTSAVLHLDGGVFMVFTTSTLFEAEDPYTPFAVLAMLEHGGDYQAAARALRPERERPAATNGAANYDPGYDEPPWADQAPPDDEPAAAALPIEGVASIAARVDKLPPPTFLARPVWPADAYGIVGAESKAGKTWAAFDLAVSVASGGAWLGQFPCEHQGGVLLFLGEGGERKTIRRLRAICDHYDTTLEKLPIRICHRVPQLTVAQHISEIRQELRANPAALVIVDPLYLAARGAKGSSLFEMATVLEPVQHTCQEFGSALVVVHHWNQTGTGKGKERFSGAGSEEWGRVLVSVSVESRATDEITKETRVVLGWRFAGDEIPDTEVKVARTVRAIDPNDLSSRMEYSILALDGEERVDSGEWEGPTQCKAAILALFDEPTIVELTKNKVREELRDRGVRFQNKTIGMSLEQLAAERKLKVRSGPRNARIFSKLDPGETLEGVA